ncbi:MAG: hypothetical protein KAT65_13975, partial [Methanophagales archaeon]|nr:hypothetical protein [Methanophagales archaeon]
MRKEEISEILKELLEKKYKKYYGKPKEVDRYISSKEELEKDDLVLLIQSLLGDEDIFAWLEFISSKLDIIAEDSSDFISMLESIIIKVKNDLAQGSFIRALINLGEKKPDLGFNLYKRIISSSKNPNIIPYAGLILGGVGRVDPENIIKYIEDVLLDDKIEEPIKAAVTKAIRVIIEKKEQLDYEEQFFEILNNVSNVKNGRLLKIEAINLNFELFKFNKDTCFENLVNLTTKNSTDSLKYMVADRLWIWGLDDTEKEFHLINILSDSNDKAILNRISYYLAKNYNKDNNATFEIISNFLRKDKGRELDYMFNEMNDNDFNFYYDKIKLLLNKETDLKVLYSLFHLINYISEINEEKK